jgi:hypothetical protein
LRLATYIVVHYQILLRNDIRYNTDGGRGKYLLPFREITEQGKQGELSGVFQ